MKIIGMWKYKDIPNLKAFGYRLACFFEFLGYLEAETKGSFALTEVRTENTELYAMTCICAFLLSRKYFTWI